MTSTTCSGRSLNVSKLDATLTGTAEVPGPGDSDATGSALVTVNSGQAQLCYKLSVQHRHRDHGPHPCWRRRSCRACRGHLEGPGEQPKFWLRQSRAGQLAK
ncbi:MAG: CHRD domain-containing protein [Sphingomonas sp.]|nr:CHRD domain-containing protein [Sphingomonas sp.]